MQCTRCNTRNPITNTICRTCGMVLPPPPAVIVPPAAPAVTPAPAVVPTTGAATTSPIPSNWERFSGFIKVKFRRTPTAAPAATVAATSAPANANNGSRFSRLRVIIAVVCTALWLYGIVKHHAILGLVPVVGVLYFVPLEFGFARKARYAITIFWVLLCAAIIVAWRTKG